MKCCLLRRITKCLDKMCSKMHNVYYIVIFWKITIKLNHHTSYMFAKLFYNADYNWLLCSHLYIIQWVSQIFHTKKWQTKMFKTTSMGKADINEVLTSHCKWLSTSGWVLRFNWSFNSIKFDLLECHTKEINQSPIDLYRFYFTNQTLFTH